MFSELFYVVIYDNDLQFCGSNCINIIQIKFHFWASLICFCRSSAFSNLLTPVGTCIDFTILSECLLKNELKFMLFQPSQENIAEIIKAIKEGPASVPKVTCGKTKYMVLRTLDGDTLFGRQYGGKQGIACKMIKSGEFKCKYSRSLKDHQCLMGTNSEGNTSCPILPFRQKMAHRKMHSLHLWIY